jgi:uncharacterized protein YdeI (YjbR/CyaY-like superfamily)
MEIGKTLYVKDRKEWRSWLAKNHDKEKEIWLIYYRKSSGKERIPYKDCVEEALCYGWIDSIAKGIDNEKFCQRFSPRRRNSVLSELNKEHIRRLIKAGKMTPFGLKAVAHKFNHEEDKKEKPKIAPDILKAIKADKDAWKNFQKFSEGYKRVRITAIEGYRNYEKDKTLFKKKLDYFIKMTAKGKTFGVLRY